MIVLHARNFLLREYSLESADYQRGAYDMYSRMLLTKPVMRPSWDDYVLAEFFFLCIYLFSVEVYTNIKKQNNNNNQANILASWLNKLG